MFIGRASITNMLGTIPYKPLQAILNATGDRDLKVPASGALLLVIYDVIKTKISRHNSSPCFYNITSGTLSIRSKIKTKFLRIMNTNETCHRITIVGQFEQYLKLGATFSSLLFSSL